MADSRIDAFTEDTAPAIDDVIYVEHDPGGTPANRKARIRNLSIPRLTVAQLPAAPVQGFTAYVTDANLPPGAVAPAVAARPNTPGLYVFDGTKWNPPWNLPWGIMGYAQVVAAQTLIGALVDLTNLTVTFTAVANRRIRISAQVLFDTASVVPVIAQLFIRDSTPTTLQQTQARGGAGDALSVSMTTAVIITPTAGAHTYKLSAQTSAGTMSLDAGATVPAFILVEDIGPNGQPA